jgi:hypothetical protein
MLTVAPGELDLSLGRHEIALAHFTDVASHGPNTGEPLMRLNPAPAFVEASVRPGQPELPATVLASIADRAAATRWPHIATRSDPWRTISFRPENARRTELRAFSRPSTSLSTSSEWGR